MLNFNPETSKVIRKLVMFLSFLTSVSAYAQIFPTETIILNGPRQNRINLVYLPDGYRLTEQSDFLSNARLITNDLFGQEPFASYKKFFNAFAIQVPSNESGAKHPGTAADEFTTSEPVANPDNYFHSTFDYNNIHRLLVPTNQPAIFNTLAHNLPEYDQAFLVVNSPYYGGSGGLFATSSTHESAHEIAVHEMGHSFGGLADEYWAGAMFAMEKPNMTQDMNPATVRWKEWYGINGIGIYPYGVTLPESQWFRPHEFCKMRVLGYPFCSVCSERLIDKMHELVNLIDDFSPSTNSFSLASMEPVLFSVFPIEINPSTIHINWFINDKPFFEGRDRNQIEIPYSRFINGDNIVKAEVIDQTPLSKSYLPESGYVHSVTWTVSNSAALPVKLKNFSGRLVNNRPMIEWKVDSEVDLLRFELEKSNDGKEFKKIASIEGKKNTLDYHYVDPQTWAKASYRLKIIEKNGLSKSSHVIWLQNAMDKFVYKVYQNSHARNYHLLCTSMNNKEQVSVRLINSEGGLLLSKDFGKINNQLDYDINLSGKPAGIYFLQIKSNNQQYTVRLLAN